MHTNKTFERKCTQYAIQFNEDVEWVYRGEVIDISSKAMFNKWLSTISNDVYSDTPIFINEMVNKHKPSSAMSIARVNFLTHLLENGANANLGFEDGKFPPEKNHIPDTTS